jgi:Arc/MetJ-type ribon-helix-helix transcriptional regulator
MKKKIPFPVSIDEELANWINKETEKGEFRNRSHLVEQAILEFKKRKEEKHE